MSKTSKSKTTADREWVNNFLDIEEKSLDKHFQLETFKNLMKTMLHFKSILFSGIALVIIATASTIAEPRLFGYAIDDAIIPKNWDMLKKIAFIFLFVEIIRVLSVMIHEYIFNFLGQKVMQELRVKLFAHLQRLPLSIYDKTPSGKLVTRVTNDVSALADIFSAGFVTLIGNILNVAGTIGYLMYLNIRLGLIAISIFPVLVVVSVIFSKKLRIAYMNARARLSALNAFLAENILGMRIVHLFSRNKTHDERFQRLNQWHAEADIQTIHLFALFRPSINWAMGTSMALVIFFGGGMAWDGTIKLGILAAFFAYVLALFSPIQEIADKWNIFLAGMVSAERIFSVLKWEPEIGLPEHMSEAHPVRAIKGHVVFDKISFAYNNEHWILRDFSLDIRPGMKIGIVGPTGAGKTTIIALLMRFYEPQSGRILIDGRDIREYDKRSLRSSIGIVQQDIYMFSGSIRDNVTLWKESQKKIEDNILSLIPRDPNTPLQERGTNLSVGEKQTISFLRAHYSDPAIWILDEATANIDTETEAKLHQLMRNLTEEKTVIMIAHRLSTVREADQIIVLNKGLIVEKGNHKELLKTDGLYARLYRYQESKEFEMEAGD